jgi:hypothetical protein
MRDGSERLSPAAAMAAAAHMAATAAHVSAATHVSAASTGKPTAAAMKAAASTVKSATSKTAAITAAITAIIAAIIAATAVIAVIIAAAVIIVAVAAESAADQAGDHASDDRFWDSVVPVLDLFNIQTRPVPLYAGRSDRRRRGRDRNKDQSGPDDRRSVNQSHPKILPFQENTRIVQSADRAQGNLGSLVGGKRQT